MKDAWWTVVVVLALISIVLHHNLLFLMSLLLALVGGTSALWARYCLVGVAYKRRFGATRLFHGEETEMSVDIVNAKPLPLPWLHAEDEMPEGVEISAGKLRSHHLPLRRTLSNLLSLRWYERVTRHYHLRGVQRGAFAFGPVEVSAEDIFGFATRKMVIPDVQTLIVYPRFVPLTTLGLPARHPFGDARTPQRLVEDPMRLMGARDYLPGDSFRYVHWKASAHKQHLQTKVFEPSATRPLAIFLNANTFEHIYEGVDRVLQELAITTAASVAHYGWENGYQVGMYVNAIAQPGANRVRIRPGSHPDQFIWILDALARTIEYGRWPIEGVLGIEVPSLAYGSTVVLVTAIITPEITQALLDVQRRRHAVVLIALGDARLDAPLPGIVYYHIGSRDMWHDLQSIRLR